MYCIIISVSYNFFSSADHSLVSTKFSALPSSPQWQHSSSGRHWLHVLEPSMNTWTATCRHGLGNTLIPQRHANLRQMLPLCFIQNRDALCFPGSSSSSHQLRPRRAQQHGSLVFVSSPRAQQDQATTCTRPCRGTHDRSSNERSPTDSASSLSEEEEAIPCLRLLTVPISRQRLLHFIHIPDVRHRTGSSLASRGYQPNPPYDDDGGRNVGGEDRLASIINQTHHIVET
jgi:hypothetical protein